MRKMQTIKTGAGLWLIEDGLLKELIGVIEVLVYCSDCGDKQYLWLRENGLDIGRSKCRKCKEQ